MAVTETVTLPDQPTIGFVRYVPLGGNGYQAPFAQYVIDNFALAGDVSGGAVQHQVIMDPRYSSLVAYLSITNVQASSADMDFKLRIDSNAPQSSIANQIESGVITAISATVSSATANKIWSPVPTIMPGGGEGGLIMSEVLNVDGDLTRLSALIYLFNIDVRIVSPIGPLLWARGAT